MDHPGISRSLVGRGARWKDARYRVWHRRSRIERSGSGLRWPNAGFIGEGVEKIDIGGEYGDQSEITAAARDKITPAPPIQIVYRETDRRSALRCPCGILPPPLEPMQLDPDSRDIYGIERFLERLEALSKNLRPVFA